MYAWENEAEDPLAIVHDVEPGPFNENVPDSKMNYLGDSTNIDVLITQAIPLTPESFKIEVKAESENEN